MTNRADINEPSWHIAALEASNRFYRETLACSDISAVAKICLSIVEKLTQSAYGFVGELNEDGHLRCIALTNPGWQACTIPDSKAALQLTSKKLRGLFARVITEARSQIENDPAHAPDRVGLPKGHPPLDRFLGVPLSQGGQVVGLIALANKTTDYDLTDQLLVETVALAFVETLARKRAELTRDRLADILEASPNLVATFDSETRLQYLNPAGRMKLGISDHQPLSDSIMADLVPPSSMDTLLSGVSDAAVKGSSQLDLAVLRPGGQEISTATTIVMHKARSGTDVLFSMIARDITEQRKVEQQLRQAQKMQAIGRLAGGVAHDFNNLITVIKGCAALSLSTLTPGVEVHGDLLEIQQAADRAAGLTRQLLAFSRQSVTEPTILNLGAVVENLQKMLKRIVGEDIRFRFQRAQDLWPVMADIGQVEQVLTNLVVNARDALPEGGEISITTANIEPDNQLYKLHPEVRQGPYVSLTVADEGEGIPADVQERIFEPFFTTKKAGRGTGLGLSTVYGIVKQAQGYIYADSQVGSGTAFSIYLPRAPRRATASVVTAPVSTAEPVGSRHTVLLVEDEESVRNVVSRYLLRLSYEVIAVVDGTHALDAMSSAGAGVDVVLTDVVMPGLNGKQLATQLIARRPDLPVVFMSGYTDDTIGHHHLREPGTIFLNKPFTMEELDTKLRLALIRALSSPS